MAKANLTAQRLCELLDYNATTGLFRWRESAARRSRVGLVAGYAVGTSRWVIGIDGVEVNAARLAWLYSYGELPNRCVIHRDGNPMNCALDNLASPRLPQETPLTQTRVKDLLHYDEQTGAFTWKTKRGHHASRGASAGHLAPSSGYLFIRIDGTLYRAHRLAWLYAYGQWPSHQIDHINGDRADNRLANLRDVPSGVNTENQRQPGRANRSGFLGVCWDAERKLWLAQIQTAGRCVALGRAASPEEAHKLYLTAKRKLHEGCTI